MAEEVAPLSEQRLQEIREREEKATPGPWSFDCRPYNSDETPLRWHTIMAVGGGNPSCGQSVAETYHHEAILLGEQIAFPDVHGKIENALFIAHARQDIPDLLAELTRSRAALRKSERKEKEWGLLSDANRRRAELAEQKLAEQRERNQRIVALVDAMGGMAEKYDGVRMIRELAAAPREEREG